MLQNQIDLRGRLPPDAAVEARLVVAASIAAEFAAEVRERTEVNSAHEFLGQRIVEALQLALTSRMVRPPIDHADAVRRALCSELLRDEASPVVDLDHRRGAPALERPPRVVRGLPSSLPNVGARHHQEAGPAIEDGVDVDVAPDPGDAELVDVDLPEGVDVALLEPPGGGEVSGRPGP